MDFPVGPYKGIPVTDEILAATGGLAQEAYYDGGDMIAVAGSEEDLAALAPEFSKGRKGETSGKEAAAK